jgi:hypothetical protein
MFGEANIVILKENENITEGNTEFKKNLFYRCCKQDKGYIIYGEYFEKAKAEQLFVEATIRVGKDFRTLGLLTEYNESISFKQFKELGDVHTYGRGRTALRIVFFRTFEQGNHLIYGFYPNQGTKAECFQYYLDTVSGDMIHVDSEVIQFGDRGIPLTYGGLRVW